MALHMTVSWYSLWSSLKYLINYSPQEISVEFLQNYLQIKHLSMAETQK